VLTASGSPSSQIHQTLAPARGVTSPPQDASSYRFLSDVIIARELVDPAAMKAALQASLAGRGLSEILVERGAISELDLARTVAEHHRLDHVDLDLFDVDHEAATLVDPVIARRLGAVPIAFLPGGTIVVVMYDPNASQAVREISQLIDRPVQPAVAARGQIEQLIDALPPHPFGPVSGVVPVPSTPSPAPVAAAPEPRLRAVPAVAVWTHPADVLRPTAPAPASAAPPAATAAHPVAPAAPPASAAPPPIPMQTRNENDERVRAAEELARIAEVRAQAADERATKAEKMLAAANSRAEGLMAAATAANEALARLVGTCEVLERDAQTREREMQALRSDLESERAERARLEEQSRDPQAGEELLALHVRIAELERELEEERAAAAPAPAPPRAAASFAPPLAPAARPDPPALVQAPPDEAVVEAVSVEEIAVAQEPDEVVEVPAPEELPSSTLTIDIVGDPGVPYVSALAPMPPIASPAKAKAKAKAKNAQSEAKARGLRRLIGALKRG
jgi:hypothetical protein